MGKQSKVKQILEAHREGEFTTPSEGARLIGCSRQLVHRTLRLHRCFTPMEPKKGSRAAKVLLLSRKEISAGRAPIATDIAKGAKTSVSFAAYIIRTYLT